MFANGFRLYPPKSHNNTSNFNFKRIGAPRVPKQPDHARTNGQPGENTRYSQVTDKVFTIC
jgi:hypothetical protein